MKLLMENWRGYLKEIGDASVPPYDFEGPEEMTEWDVVYEFYASDEFGEIMYTVQFERHPRREFKPGEKDDWRWDIGFQIGGGKPGDLTEQGQPLKIMSTVVAIIKDFIDRPEFNDGTRGFRFKGVPKKGESSRKTTQRTKLYLRFLEKHLPDDWEFNVNGKNEIFFGPKNEETE